MDLDAPDASAFPGCDAARGVVVELTPGQLLYIPPGWWHHVQTCSSPCVSMAWWFFERTKQQVAAAAAAEEPTLASGGMAVDPRAFGIGRRATGLFLTRWIEDAAGRVLEVDAHRAGTREAALVGHVAGSPRKQRAVARCLLRIGWLAAARLTSAADPQLSAVGDRLLRGRSLDELLVADASAEGPLPAFVNGADFAAVEDAVWSGVAETAAAQFADASAVDAWLVEAVLVRRYEETMQHLHLNARAG